MRVGLTTTAIFGDLSGYFFGTFSDKASSIIWRHWQDKIPNTEILERSNCVSISTIDFPSLCCMSGLFVMVYMQNVKCMKNVKSVGATDLKFRMHAPWDSPNKTHE